MSVMQLIPECEPKLQDINRSLLIIEVNCQEGVFNLAVIRCTSAT